MLRLFVTQGFNFSWKCSRSVTSFVTKKHVSNLLRVKSASHHPIHILPRHFSSEISVERDLQTKTGKSEEEDTLDLDRWKSIMKSQVVLEEKQVSDKVETSANNINEKEPDDGDSLLEATRDLVAMWRLAGKRVPQVIKDDELRELSKLTTKSARKKYLKYLAIKESFKLSRKDKQQQKLSEREAVIMNKTEDTEAVTEDDQTEKKNRLLRMYNERCMDITYAWRGAQAMIYGQPLVFDMSYEANMCRRETDNTVSQLLELEGWNRRATDPFHLHYCNLQPDGPFMQRLLKKYGADAWDRLLITSTQQHYVDLFPREQLVYLTADSPNVLHKFDHSKVYIIGALVDRSIQSGLSLANAKRLKLATARLPLDNFLNWEVGGKNLTLDQMMRIMLTIKNTGKWEEALKFVPQRKLRAASTTSHEVTIDIDKVLRFGERNSGMKKPVLSEWNNRNNTKAATRTRVSLKKTMEARVNANKRGRWWQEDQ